MKNLHLLLIAAIFIISACQTKTITMKKIILLLFSILPFCIFAQVSNISLDFCNPEYPISYNKKDKSEITETKNKYVKFGETVNFTIKNVNTQLYSVTLDGENITYNSEIPAALKIFTAASAPDETTPKSTQQRTGKREVSF